MAENLVFLNKRWIKLKNARVSVLDRAFMLGDGLFETLRAYNGNIFRLDFHLDRLFISAEVLGISIPYKPKQLQQILQSSVKKNQLKSAYIRLTVTRGEGFIHQPLDMIGPPNVVVISRSYQALSETYYRRGVSVTLFPEAAQSITGLNIRVKACNYLPAILLKNRAKKVKVFEAILLKGRNKITEGTTSNIFIVKNGILKTPRLNRWVLAGITRKVVLEIARKRKISYLETGLTKEDLLQADEAFLTNTGYEILPITRVDKTLIGEGKPGPLTRKIRKAFLKTIEEETLSC